jgi:hypothetical protein
MPSCTDYAWLAGVIDGEGSIALTWIGKGKVPGLKIIIYGSDLLVMNKVRAIIRAAGIWCSYSPDNRTGKSNYRVSISSKACIKLYPLVSPYMVRQISRYKAGVEFLTPRYALPLVSGARWDADGRDAFKRLRAAHGLNH